MQNICPNCGTSFSPKYRHSNQKYCSKSCVTESQQKPKVVCLCCGKEFRPASGTRKPKYCSRICYVQARSAPKKTCPQCGKIFTYQHIKTIHCSRECSNKSMKLQRGNCIFCGKTLDGAKSHEYNFCNQYCRADFFKTRDSAKFCINCGVYFTPIRFLEASGRYAPERKIATCSKKCGKEHMSGKNHHLWQGGKSVLEGFCHRGSGWVHIAEKARNRDGRVCQKCGKTEAENGRKMDVHHIIAYHDINDTKKANRISNLISLCKVCHRSEEHKLKHQQIVLPFALYAQADRRAARVQ